MFVVSYVLWDKNAKNAIPLYPLDLRRASSIAGMAAS